MLSTLLVCGYLLRCRRRTLLLSEKENCMLTIKCPSDKPCFICGTSERTADVSFADKTFRGVLCMEHIYEKLRPEKSEKDSPRVPIPLSR